ncbi:hypothetical protein [Candidatus Tisiphia endosymbiont of Ptychoptera albimana]|uniref:preprotein translocase subunit SecA n=1 Tax=Candidatus Tisiphia endosymbiont of Ptychoptera albimana TaxID=3066260 RepID=UPI00312CA7A9
MITDTDQGLLKLDDASSQHANEFNIDIIIQDFINAETGKILTLKNFQEIYSKITDTIQQELNQLTQNLLRIVQDRATYETTTLNNQVNLQIEQKQTALKNQCDQEINARMLAINQSLKSMTFTSQAAADSTFAAKQAEFQSFQTSYVQQISNLLQSHVTTVIQDAKNQVNTITNTAQKVLNQKNDYVSSIVKSKLSSLTDELIKLEKEGYNIDVTAIENYNKTWLNSLHNSINALYNKSINDIANQTISHDSKTFEQFINGSGKRETIIHKNQLDKLLTDIHAKNYALPTDHLEKLFSLIEDPRCNKIHDTIIPILLSSTINGSKLSLAIFKKLENLLDDRQHAELAATILFKSVENKQLLPDTTLNKLSCIAGNKSYSILVWTIANQTIASSLAYGTELLDDIVSSFINNNFILKIYDNNLVLKGSINLADYFYKHSEALVKYSDRIISIVGDKTLNPDVRRQLCLIIKYGIENGYKLSQDELVRLEAAFTVFPLDKTLEILKTLESVVKLQDATLHPATLEKLVIIIRSQEIEPSFRVKCLEILLSIIEHGQDIATSLVQVLIETLSDSDYTIKKKATDIIKYLFKSGNNDYNLSTKEIDLLSNILNSTTIAETRDILAYIIGHYAGKNITTKSAVDTIYDLVNSEHFTNQIVFALKNISKNYKYELPIHIFQKLVDIGLNGTNTNLRLFALESVSNLSEHSRINLGLKTIDLLLHDPNPKIKVMAIKLVKYHFEKTKQLPEQLVQSLASNSSSNELLSQSALEILGYVANKGESLPKQALDLFGWILFNHNDQSIRDKAFAILEKCKAKQVFTKDMDDILVIEKLSQTMISSSDDNQKIDAAKEVENLAKQGVKLTKNCFQNLRKLLIDDNKVLLELAANTISYAVDSNQEIPNDILITLKNSLSLTDDMSALIIAFYKLVNATSYSDDEIIKLAENLLVSDKSSSLPKEYMRMVLKTLTARGKYLSHDTIEYISLSLLNDSDYKAQIASSYILHNIVSNGQVLTKNVHTALMYCLQSDKEELYCNAISCFKDISSRGYDFSVQELSLIKSFLQKDTKVETQQNILKILKNISSHSKQKFIELELDEAVNSLNTNTDSLSNINHIITLLDDVEFVSKKVIETLKYYLCYANSQISDLCAKGLAIILGKTNQIILTTEQTDKLSSLLHSQKDNAHIVILLEEAQKQCVYLSKITLIRLIDDLGSDLTSDIKLRVISILEIANIKLKLDEQLIDLFYLAKESTDIKSLMANEQKLFKILKALKTKINLNQEPNSYQYELLSHGLKNDDSKITSEANECLELLLLKHEIPINESFIQLIWPIIQDNLFLTFIKKLFSSNLEKHPSLVNDAIERLEVILGKSNNLLFQQEALDAIEFLSQQKVGLSSKIINYIEQCLDNRILQITAFKILKDQADQGVYSLSDKCLDVLNKLAESLEFDHLGFLKDIQNAATDNEQLSIFTALLDIKYFNNEVLSRLPSYKYWIRELLSYDLVMRTKSTDSYDLESFDINLIELEKKHNYDVVSKERDNLLLSLINLQQEKGYNLRQINQILELLIDLPANILSKLDKTKDAEYELRLIWLKSKFFPNLGDAELQLLYQGFFEQNNWTTSIVNLFLQYLPKDTSVTQIGNFLSFIQENEISFEQVNELLTESFEENGGELLNKWQEVLAKNILEIYIAQQFSKILDQTTEGQEIIKLLEVGWSIKSIKVLSDNILIKSNNNLQNLQKLLKATQIIYHYKIAEDFISKDGLTVFKIIKDFDLDHIEIGLHKLAVEQNFQQSLEKDIETLLNEIALKNKDDQLIQSLIDNNVLKCEVQDIERKYNSTSAILLNNKPIKLWSKEDIQNWSNLIKGDLAKLPEHQAEILAVIKKANILDSTHEPRVVQQLSILLMLHTEATGRLVQISTGEGKSMTVAMLAVIKALRGEVVDVVTSSSVLAKRDAEEKADFFSMFKLTVKDNSDNSCANPKEKDCYTKNIVYGSVENFQFDLLRDMHSGLDIRKGRPFGIVIIDEVDSMLIDEGSKIAKLSSPLPQMEYLEHLLSLTWQHLEKIEKHFYFSYESNQLLWIKCNFTSDNGELRLANTDGSYEDEVVKVHNRLEYTRFLLHEYLKQYINQLDGCFIVPSHLRDFALEQIDKWISSAICAKHVFEEGKHYLVANESHKSNKIVPVDFANTGILQFKTSWSNGLHQFLEIKHGLKVSPENLTTSFISNMGFFNKYGKNIFGMTGTLGNKDTHELLENIYPIKISFIPPYKHKQFIELPGIVAADNHSWLSEIVGSVTCEAKKGRAVLVICETINEVERIKRALVTSNYPLSKINRYARNDNEEYLAVSRNIDSGEIILATNLAGRGTDLKTTPQVEKAGGLHVCLTFLPDNQRVEDQAFGRTSRQGKSGTGQLVINEVMALDKLNYDYTSVNDIAAIKELRDSIEQSRLKQIRYLGLYKTLISDELFLSFNDLYQSIKQQQPKEMLFKLKQLEELWGFWLHKVNLDEDEGINLSRVSFHSYLKEMKLKPHRVTSGEDSFYHSIIHQLKYLHIETNKARNIDKLKHTIINHIIDNPILYSNVTDNLEKFANDYFKPSKWNDDLFIKSISRIFEVNIILITNDNSYKHYKRMGATETLYISHEIDGDYSSLVKSDLANDYDTTFQTNVEIDDAQVSKPSISSNTIDILPQAAENIVPTIVDNKTELETISSIQLKSSAILDYFKVLEDKLAKINGQQKQQQAKTAYEQFKQKILTEYNANRIAKNPSYETLQANLLLKLDSYDQAMEHYNNAIELDKIYSFVAHYNKAYAVTDHGGGVDEPKSDLLAAKDQLEGHLIPQLESTQMVLISNSDIATNSDLTKQLTNKINLLKLQLDHINKALVVIATVEHKNKVTKDAVAAGTIPEEQASTFKIAIDDTKKLKDFFEQAEIPEDEIAELEHLGLDHLFTLREVEIMPEEDDDSFIGAIAGCLLGIGQIIFGAVTMACGGISLGIAMIVEGVKDLYTVVTGGFDHGFSWEQYFSSKAISYTISAITMGWDNFKAGLLAVKEGITAAATGIKNIALQALGREVIKQGAISEVTKSATSEIVKEGLLKSAFEIAKKEIPNAILSVGAQHAIGFVADRVSDNIIQEFRDDIASSVKGKINDVINDSLTANTIDRAVLVDTMLGTNSFTANIMKEMALILRPEENAFINAASSIIKAIAQQYHSGIATFISLAEKAATVDKILNVTDRFCHKLSSKLSSIASELPSNQEIFNIYMQLYLSSEDRTAIYNILITEKILNNEGKIIGEDLSKINNIDLGQNNKLKPRILSFCTKLKHVQEADNKEVRVKVASNVEHMITNRIMHLIKAEILSPTIKSGISELSNAMLNKLNQASEAAKTGVKREMSKHYNRVTLTPEAEHNEPQRHNSQFSQYASPGSFPQPSSLNAATSKSSSSFTNSMQESSSLPYTEGSMYLESLSNQMARPVYLFKDGQLQRIIGSQYKGTQGFSLDYVMGQGWKRHNLLNSNEPPRSLFDLMYDETASTNTSILLKKSEDPRLKFHTPYSQYIINGKTVNNTKSPAQPPLSQEPKPSSQPVGAGQHPEPITSADIGFAGLTSADIALLSLAKPKPLPVPISQKTTEYLNSVVLQSGWQQASSTEVNKQSGEFTLDEQATIAAVGGDIGLDYDPRAKKFIEENPGTALALAAAPYVGMGVGLLGEIGATARLLPTIAAEGGGGSQLANAGSRLLMTEAAGAGANVAARIGSTAAAATPINPLYTALHAATAATTFHYGLKAIEDTNNSLGQNYTPTNTDRPAPQQSQVAAIQPVKVWDVNEPVPTNVNPCAIIDLDTNKPTILTTPIPSEKPITVISTPDQGELLQKLGTLPGFDHAPSESIDTNTESFPAHVDSLVDMSILYKDTNDFSVDKQLVKDAEKLKLDKNNPTDQKILENLDTPVEEFIAKNRKAKIFREFPGEYLDVPLREVMEGANRGDSIAKKAKKLLIDGRFSK